MNAVPAPEPPEAQTIRSMLHIARIIALIFGIIWLLAGLAYAAFAILAWEACTSVIGDICYSIGLILVGPIFLVIFGIVDFLIYINCRAIEAKVNNHQYESAKHDTLIWMIIGFILGGVITGILLLIAYLKFDPLINATRQYGGGAPPAYGAPPPPGYGAPPPAAAAPPPPAPGGAPPPPPAAAPAAASSAPFCGNCGKPTTYVPQYGRYYCYDCKQYV